MGCGQARWSGELWQMRGPIPKFFGEVSGHFTMFNRVLQNQMLQKCLVPSLSAMVLRMRHASQALSALLGMHN